MRILSRSVYIDDICGEAHKLYIESKDILKAGGSFVTNSRLLQAKMDHNGVVFNASPTSPVAYSSEETYIKSTLGNTQRLRSGEQKVLGV